MRKYEKYYWPTGDRRTPFIVMNESKRIPLYLKWVNNFSTCLQAGGNVGVYANILAESFSKVITVEPDSENYECLNRNVTKPNVVKIHAALSSEVGFVDTFRPDFEKENYGATQIKKTEVGIKTVRIDDMNLDSLDFLMLDIEGWEHFALLGAAQTIEKFKPTISLELKGLGKKNGYTDQQTKDWLNKTFGYTIKEEIGKDWIFVV